MRDAVPCPPAPSAPSAAPPAPSAPPAAPAAPPAAWGRRRALAQLGLLAAAGAAGPACSPPVLRPSSRRVGRSGQADFALVGATVFPAPGAPPLAKAVVVVREGRIAAVNERARSPVDVGRVVDLRGAFVTAGLWNCHVHFSGSQWASAGQRPAAELGGALRAMLTRHGFTSAVDLGSDLANTLALRARVRRGELAGPAIFSAGPPLYPRGGVPIYLRALFERLGVVADEIGTADEAAKAVRERVAAGADLVKIFTGSPVGGGRAVHMAPEAVRAAVGEAHALGKLVAAHPQTEEGVRRAVEGGVDLLAHTAPGAGALPPALLAQMRRQRLAVVPTLTLWHRGVVQEGAPEADALALQARGVEQLRGLVAAEVELLFGTDVGYMDHADTADELRLLAAAGLGFDRLLATLTTEPARRFGLAGRSGQVAAGHDADLAVFASDPRADPAHLAAPRLTLRGGRVLYDPAAPPGAPPAPPGPAAPKAKGAR